MEIIEYSEEFFNDASDLLVELEEYIISIDKDNLDNLSKDYRNKMLIYDLNDVKNNQGKCYLAIENNKALGLIMGYVRKWEEADYLDYKCPKTGCISELIVTSKIRSHGVGTALMKKMEEYFKSINCTYITIDVFAYNEIGKKFYQKEGYHPRMESLIRKIGD